MNNGKKNIPNKGIPFESLFIYILLCLLIGFFSGEIMGWVMVAQSNKILLAEQYWLVENGYIAIPGTNLRSEIESWKTHFAGGLFFGLSMGLCYAFIWGLLMWGLPWPKIQISISLILVGLISTFCIFTRGKAHCLAFNLFLIIVPFYYVALFHFGIQKKSRTGIITSYAIYGRVFGYYNYCFYSNRAFFNRSRFCPNQRRIVWKD